MKLNKNDLLVLNTLQENARLSVGRMGNQLKMSPQTVLNRRNFLEKERVIKRYTCSIDWRKIGFQVYELWVAALPLNSNRNVFDAIKKILTDDICVNYFKYVTGAEQFVFGIIVKDEREVLRINDRILRVLREVAEVRNARIVELLVEL